MRVILFPVFLLGVAADIVIEAFVAGYNWRRDRMVRYDSE